MSSASLASPSGPSSYGVMMPPPPRAGGTGGALDRTMPGLLAAAAVPGASLALIRQGRIVAAGAYGMQSPGVPATPATRYDLGPLARPLTAEIILRLAARGIFGLDDPMHACWTDPDIAGDARIRLLTPRLALTHQTGLADRRDPRIGLRFQRDPGTGFEYSGEGYDYVARFAERKTGKSFETLARTQLFAPAGMDQTVYGARPIPENRSAPFTVQATAHDYALFLLNVLRDKGLSAALGAERMRVQRSLKQGDCAGALAASCPRDIGPGLGWQVLVFPRRTILLQAGKAEGVHAFAWLDKTQGDGAVILANSGNGAQLVRPLLASQGAADLQAYLRDRMD